MLKIRYILSRGYNTNIIQFQLSTGFVFGLREVLLRNQCGLSHAVFLGPQLPTFAFANFSIIWAALTTVAPPSALDCILGELCWTTSAWLCRSALPTSSVAGGHAGRAVRVTSPGSLPSVTHLSFVGGQREGRT